MLTNSHFPSFDDEKRLFVDRMKQAKVIDGKRITATDTGIYFKKHK